MSPYRTLATQKTVGRAVKLLVEVKVSDNRDIADEDIKKLLNSLLRRVTRNSDSWIGLWTEADLLDNEGEHNSSLIAEILGISQESVEDILFGDYSEQTDPWYELAKRYFDHAPSDKERHLMFLFGTLLRNS